MNLNLINRTDIEMFPGEERWYRIIGETEWKPSVTTMIGKVLSKGEIYDRWMGNQPSYQAACDTRDKAAKRGTLVHTLCENYLKGERVYSDDKEIAKRMMSFDHWVHKHNPKIIALEPKLIHKDVPFSGTADIICEINGQMTIVDIKTGMAHDEHQLQLMCYKRLWDHICPSKPIKKMYGLYLKGTWITKVEPQFKEYKDNPFVIKALYDLWTWKVKGGPRKEKPFDTTFKRRTQNDKKKLEEVL
jgi:hypothetical protein